MNDTRGPVARKESADRDGIGGPAQRPGGALRISVLVALMTMLAPFSIDTYLPSFPDIAEQFGASNAAMQQTLSLYLFAFAFSSLIYGPLADAFGRRVVVLGGVGLYVLASAGSAMAWSTESLIGFRIAQGLTASAGIVVGRAVVRDVFSGPEAQRVMSNVMMLFAIAPAVAPLVGGLLHDFTGWRSVFWFLALLGLGLWLLVWTRLPETLPVQARHSIHPLHVGKLYFRAGTRGAFLVVVAIIALNFGGMFLYVAGSPVLIYQHLGLDAASFAVLFIPLVAGLLLGSFTSARLSERWPPLRTVSAGFVVMTGAALANVAQSQLWAVTPALAVAPIALYAFGMSLSLPSLSLIALDYFPHNRGLASAVQGFVHVASNGVIAGVLVPLVAPTLTAMALGMLALQGGALLLWLLWRSGRRRALP